MWSIIAQQLPGRTEIDVKIYWNSKLKKKLSEMGIDHVTHKPFSQIMADYSNIGAFPNPIARASYINREYANSSFTQKPEQFSNCFTTSPEGFLSNSISNYTTDPQPLDLLAQLQSITLLSTDATTVRSLVGDALALVVQNIATIVAGVVIAFSANWILALIIVAVLPLMLVQGFLQTKFNKEFSADAKVMYEQASQVANDAVGSIRTVASFCAEEKVSTLIFSKKLITKNLFW